MKKQKLKNLLKHGILLFGISLLFTNCEKEDFKENVINQYNSKLNLNWYKTDIQTAFNANNRLEKHISSKFYSKKNSNYTRINSDEYNFSIDENLVQVISSDNYESFTFLVERDTYNPDILENYVYTSFSNGGYTQMLISYPIIYSNGEISYDINNSIATYIQDDSLIYSARPGSPCNNTTEEIIEWDENAGECVDYDCTAGGNHSPGDSCNGDEDEQPYTECTGGWVVTGCIQFGSGGSSGTGTSGSTGGGGGSSNNNEPNDTEEEIPVIPLDDLGELGVARECRKVTDLLGDPNNATFKAKLLEISSDSSLNLNFEKSIGLFENQATLDEHSGNPNEAATRMLGGPPNKYIAYAHNHPNDSIGTLSIFSFDDLMAFAKTLYNDDMNTSSFVAFLATKKGTKYALTIHNKSKFLSAFYMYNNPFPSTVEEFEKYQNSVNQIKDLQKEYFNPNNPNRKIKNSDTDNQNVLIQFLNFMNSANAGITLFEANNSLDINNNGTPFDSFTRVTIKNDGTIKRNYCNN